MVRACCLLLAALAGCGGDDEECVIVDTACQPLYDPVYDEVFARTFQTRCGVDGTACHGANGRKAGLVFADPDEAYDLLLDGRVVPGDPGCSLLIRRIASDDSGFVMPPGAPLIEQERCAVIQWVATGAER